MNITLGIITMPFLIKHIDQIAREKQRDVLYVDFDRELYPDYDYKNWQIRQDLINWLDEQDISYQFWAGMASEYSFESYHGQLYLDVIYDENDPVYQRLSRHLEDEQGKPKIKGVLFFYCPLDMAMQNKHHDEPGFWEN